MILHATRHGRADGPPVVLLHAIGASCAMWQRQLDLLSDRLQLVTIDLPGHGDSPLPAEGATAASFARDVIDTLDALGLERVVLVGLSLGSMIAQCVAAAAPDRISALVLSNGIGFAPDPVRAIWAQRLADAQAGGMASTVSSTLERWFTPDFLAADPPEVQPIARQIAATPIAGFAAAARVIMALDNRDALARITAPALVLAGEFDTASPPQAVRLVADAIPDARFETLPAGHLMNVELAEAYSARLLTFLQKTGK